MLITFFNIKVTVHFEFIPQGQTVNQAYYVEILIWLREAVHKEGHELLHHDNAPAHKALSVKQFLVQKPIAEMEHPTYYPDLAPNDFWLFPKIKSALKGPRFQDTEDMTEKAMALKAVPQQEFQNCFQQWQHCLAKCTATQGRYFKGDPSQQVVSIWVCLQ
jgi:hypothetical protein